MNIITPTADGSKTLFNPVIGENYHSSHGALQESKHVFLNAGLIDFIEKSGKDEIDILEVGFGTGLNFLMSFDYCENHQIKLNYVGIEAFPLNIDAIEATEYGAYVDEIVYNKFLNSYDKSLSNRQNLTPKCQLEIVPTLLADFKSNQNFDVVYFDAFSVRHQPEMWTEEIIAHTCNFIKSGGFFVTYAITGNLKRAIKANGFEVQKLHGAAGKREMLRGVKK